jgi:REP element-mobilizing transposase RayT
MHPPLEPDYYYHIYNRGNNGENLFVEDMNYRFFLEKYAKYCYPVFDTFCYCLLKNHFHLFVRIRNQQETEELLSSEVSDENMIKRLSGRKWTSKLISRQLGHAFNSYTQAFNKKYDRTGSLFERPFERLNVDNRSYFCNLICYIHRNPQKHGLIDDFNRYPYSSYTAYLSDKPTKLNRKETLRWFGGKESFTKIHKEKAELDKCRIEE